MKKIIFLITIMCVFSMTAIAEDTDKSYNDKVKSADAIISSLYAVISGEKGQQRDWELFKYLFHSDAKLIYSQKNQDGKFVVKYMSPQDYIEGAGIWLVENGFFEKQIHKTVNTFGTITQVFSTYESFHSQADKTPFSRGINSIQLHNDGQRWWVINIYWISPHIS